MEQLMNNPQQHDLDQFCQKYTARVEESSSAVWAKPLHPSQPTAGLAPVKFQYEPMMEITLPKDALEQLLDQEAAIRHAEQDGGWRGHQDLARIREQRAREANPALEQAWQRYQLLLNLTKDQY
jgi:hypothetical protein